MNGTWSEWTGSNCNLDGLGYVWQDFVCERPADPNMATSVG